MGFPIQMAGTSYFMVIAIDSDLQHQFWAKGGAAIVIFVAVSGLKAQGINF